MMTLLPLTDNSVSVGASNPARRHKWGFVRGGRCPLCYELPNYWHVDEFCEKGNPPLGPKRTDTKGRVIAGFFRKNSSLGGLLEAFGVIVDRMIWNTPCRNYKNAAFGHMCYRNHAALVDLYNISKCCRKFQEANSPPVFVCRMCNETRPWFQEMRITPCKNPDCVQVSFYMECAVMQDVTHKATHPQGDFMRKHRIVVLECETCYMEGTRVGWTGGSSWTITKLDFAGQT
jgi:hypothetical protein